MPKRALNPALTQQKVPTALSRGDQRKLALVEATIAIVAREGLPNLTFETVGDRCRISKSHVAYHFPSLENLLRTSVAHVYTVGQRTVSEYIQNAAPKGDLLQAYVYGTFHWIESHPDHAAVAALLGYLATWDADYRRIQTEIKTLGQTRIAALLQARYGKKTSPALADSVQSLLMGKILYFTATAKERPFRQVRTETWRAIQGLLP